jgi:hypothetical protein
MNRSRKVTPTRFNDKPKSPMSANAFIGKAEEPTEAELAAALGPAKAIWDQLIDDLAEECGIGDQEWNSYSRKAGCSLRLKREQRNIVYESKTIPEKLRLWFEHLCSRRCINEPVENILATLLRSVVFSAARAIDDASSTERNVPLLEPACHSIPYYRECLI